jgi:hypothetical protein
MATHEPLHLDKQNLVKLKIVDIPVSFIWIIDIFDGAFYYGGISKFWGYDGTNAELLCVECCNFGQCHIFVNYLSSYF